MKIAFNPSTVAALTSPPDNKDITFDLKGHSIYARGVEFKGTDTNTWRDIKVNNVSIGSHTLDLRNGGNTTLTNTNGVVTINSTWRPVVDNLTSNSATSSLSANQGRILAGLINGKSDSDHNHDGRYLKLTGGTLTGNLIGTSAMFSGRFYGNGDDEGIIIKPSSNGYAGLILGTHDGERSIFYFVKNKPFWRYSHGSDNLDIIHPKKSGTIALTSDIPLSLKNPHALTISLNGTSQGPYDGSAAKNINITPGSIGAATSDHNHDGRYVRAFGTSNDNIDSDWGQSFKTFDPVPSGTPPEKNPNISLLSIGDNFIRRKQLAFIYNNDNIYYRRHVGKEFSNWRRIAFANEIPTSVKNPYSLTTFGVVYDGSVEKVVSPSNFISQLEEGTGVVTDGTMFVTSCASDKGFADTNAVNVPYKRKAVHLWDYIKTKTDTLYSALGHNHDNKYLRWFGNAGQSNMNAIGRISHSSGMTDLRDPGNTTDNPMEGNIKSISWHLYWQTNYTDNPGGSNAWVAQIVNRAGTDRWWVRSRSGGTITNSAGWTSNWRFLVTAPTSGLGGSSQPIYINSAGEVVAANSYPTSLPANGGNADTVDGWHKNNIQWTGYITSPSSIASYWFKMYDITVTGYQYNDITITFLVSEGYSSHFSIFYLRIRQHGTNNSGNYNLGISLYELVGNLRDKVVAYYNNSTGNVQLWGNTGGIWSTMNYTILKKTFRTDTDSASLGTLTAQSFSSVQTPPSTGYSKVTMSRVGSVSYSDSTGSVHWNNVTNKPSSFTPSSHTHTWTSITDKIVAGNEFNIVNAGFKDNLWLNFLPINDRSKSATIDFYHLGNGHKGYASLIASGFLKNGSSDSYVLLGGGGHKLESALNVANADTLDGAHLIRYGNGTGIKQVYYFHTQGNNTSYIKLGTLNTVAVTGAGSSKVMFTVKGGINFRGTNESVYEVAASTRGSIQVTSTLVRGNRELKFGYVSTSSNVEIWMAYDGIFRGVTEVEVSSSISFTLAMTETTTKPSGFVEGSYRILASTADNVASATNAYHLRINSANTWSTWYWAGQGGQPNWLWGSNDGTNMYVWNPSNFRVAYAASAGNAETLGGMPKNNGQAPFGTIPCIGNDGVMEIGRYIDYHYDNSGKYDFSTRLQTTGNYGNVVSLPSASGTLALISQVVTADTGLLRYSRNNVNISSSNCSSIPPSLLEWTIGYPRLYDPEFNDGYNNVGVYNNAGNGVVTVTRVHDTNVGNSSSYVMKVVSAAGAIPNYGGWHVATQTELGKVYTCLFRANIPSGVEIEWNSNSIGTGGQMSWLTNNMGTGKWTWYAVQVYCGSGGSTTFFFSAKSPCTWYLSYVNVIENNRASYAGLRSVYSDYLKANASIVFGRNELQYFNQYTGVTAGATSNANPKTDWYHILRMNHANDNGYFVDLAIPFFDNRIQFRRITNGTDNGWRRIITEEPNHNVLLCDAGTGGNVGIANSNPSQKLDVNGHTLASGFIHRHHQSDDAVLLAGGGYKTLNSIYGGDINHPVFLGYLNLDHGNDGTVSSSFSCLGYSVPFTYTRGGNYCRITIPNTTYQVFYIRAATASVNYSGGGMDTWVGYHRGSGAWWLHCYASGANEVKVKGFRQSNDSNDSWWGGNPLWSNNDGANKITVCIFGYVKFR